MVVAFINVIPAVLKINHLPSAFDPRRRVTGVCGNLFCEVLAVERLHRVRDAAKFDRFEARTILNAACLRDKH